MSSWKTAGIPRFFISYPNFAAENPAFLEEILFCCRIIIYGKKKVSFIH
ncbi:MAG: hypothetical protein PWQ60_1683 [Thermoanaerobacteraceae bacterium]|nr:hypothetical protein [Thermoanaerobacteraceae bacterium]